MLKKYKNWTNGSEMRNGVIKMSKKGICGYMYNDGITCKCDHVANTHTLGNCDVNHCPKEIIKK